MNKSRLDKLSDLAFNIFMIGVVLVIWVLGTAAVFTAVVALVMVTSFGTYTLIFGFIISVIVSALFTGFIWLALLR